MIGKTLAHYEITGLLGKGGMGEVYLAVDSRLDREVAIKILPEALAADPERLERFQREAKSVAALNHPQIVTIHSVEEVDGVHLLTMEVVKGKSLDKILPELGFDLERFFDLGVQIADGLAAAHDKGITHRDLKPANVMVTDEGRVKILDFGLAKLAQSESAPEDTELLTQDGMILGTVPYMSPEQVQGLPVDARSDIFSLAILLYEMATGRRPFQGDNPASVISAVLTQNPAPVTQFKVGLPNHLGRIIRRCLEKKPERRYQSARDVQLELEELQKESRSAPLPDPGTPGSPSAAAAAGNRVSWLKLTALGVVAVLLGLALGYSLRRPREIEPPRIRTLTVSGYDSEPAASPDGSLVAFRSRRGGRSRIWLKQLATGGEELVTEGEDSRPRFSPDGSALLFARDEGAKLSIYRQAIVGGQARKVIDNATGADWSPDGTRIAFTRTRSEDGTSVYCLGLTDAQGGNERILARVNLQLDAPRWSPDGSTLAAVKSPLEGTNGEFALLLVDTASGDSREIRMPSHMPVSGPSWAGNEGLIYAQGSSIIGDDGDPLSRVVRHSLASGEERTLFWEEELFPFIGQRLDSTTLGVLDADSLIFHTTSTRQALQEVSLDGSEAERRELTRGEGRDRQPVYSPDGREVLFSSNRSGNLDLWGVDLETDELRQLTDDLGQDYDPGLSPDGETLVWTSDRSGNFEIWIADADGSGGRQLTQDGVDAENPTMTADGQWVVYWSSHPEKSGVWKIRPDGSDLSRVANGQFSNSEVSPDGRYVAYLSQRPGDLETMIFVSDIERAKSVPFQIRVGTPAVVENIIFGRCRWALDGRTIAFVGADEDGRTGIYEQAFVPGEETSATRRRLVGFDAEQVVESFGFSPDGKRITLAMLDYTWQLKVADGLRIGS